VTPNACQILYPLGPPSEGQRRDGRLRILRGDSGYTGAGTRNEKTRVWDGESFLSPSE